MFDYLRALPPDEREATIARFKSEIEAGTFDPVPFYKSAALQHSAKEYSDSMIKSITFVTGGVILGASVLGFQVALLAGGLILAQQFMNSWKKQNQISDDIEDDKDFVPFLSKGLQREYRQMNAAMLESSGKALPYTEEAKQGKPVVGGYPATVHTQTIATTAQAVPTSTTTQFITDVEEVSNSELYNPAIDLGSDPYSALIVGVPGSGKGVFFSNAVRTLKTKHPHITIVGVDPKAKPEELGLWSGGFDKVYSRSILNDDPDTVAKWIERIIQDVRAMQGPTLLVVDELTALQSKLKNISDKELKPISTIFEDYLTSLASLGNASQKYVWGVGQASQGTALPFSTAVRNQLRTIALASSENVAAVQGLLRTDLIPGPAKSIEQVIEALNKSEVCPNKVAVFDGKHGQWFPMPKLRNYGQDRKAIAVQDSPVPTQAATNFVEPDLNSGTVEGEILDRETATHLITQIISLGIQKGNPASDYSGLVEMIATDPEKGVWQGLKQLDLLVTPASMQIFGTGTGGSGFQKTRKTYKALEEKYGPITSYSKPADDRHINLWQWRRELGREPSLEEMRQKWIDLTGSDTNDASLLNLIEMLKKKEQTTSKAVKKA